MRRPVFVFACLCAAAATGCGGGGNEPKRPQRPAPVVDLEIAQPTDMTTVRSESVDVKGTVTPAGAAVLVFGQRAPVSPGGSFTATVPLEPGANVIDVMATASGRTPALTAFRVTREMLVSVPDLGGKTEPDVDKALAALGLEPDVQKGGGLLEELLPGNPAVCEQDPNAGTQVRRGSTVHVVVSKSC